MWQKLNFYAYDIKFKTVTVLGINEQINFIIVVVDDESLAHSHTHGIMLTTVQSLKMR